MSITLAEVKPLIEKMAVSHDEMVKK